MEVSCDTCVSAYGSYTQLIIKEPDLSTTVMVVHYYTYSYILCRIGSYKIIGGALLIVIPLVAAFLVYIIAT